MQVIHDALGSADLPYAPIVTIGNYDGIHRGQRSVIDKVIARAREENVQAVVITFDPHPRQVLRPEDAPKMLTPGEQRYALLKSTGIDALLEIKFTNEFAATPAEQFVRSFLHETLAVQEIYVGSTFCFGHRRQGDLAMLQSLGEELGFRAFGVDEMIHRADVISSTRIRKAVLAGEAELAMDLLGRPYTLHGTVQRGDRMGARLGWPTINVHPENEVVPAQGVYVGQVHFPSFPATFDCVTNVGTRPTVYEHYQQVVESHILGFSADVYGEKVEVGFCKRLREEKLFPNVMELSAQIGRDVESAKEYFATRRRLEEQTGEAT